VVGIAAILWPNGQIEIPFDLQSWTIPIAPLADLLRWDSSGFDNMGPGSATVTVLKRFIKNFTVIVTIPLVGVPILLEGDFAETLPVIPIARGSRPQVNRGMFANILSIRIARTDPGTRICGYTGRQGKSMQKMLLR
jgi:hypothetical protein